MKKLMYSFGIFLAFFFSCQAYAQQLNIYTENYPNGQFLDEKGNPAGYVVEMVQAIQKKVNNTDKIEIIPWKRAYSYATDPDRKNVVLFATAFTEERRHLFKWVGPVDETSMVFFARKDSQIKINNLDDAKKVKTIGVYLGDVREDYLKKQNFTNLKSVGGVDGNLSNYKKLISGRITLWCTSGDICDEMKLDSKNLVNVFTFNREGMYITFHKNTNDDIVNAWRKAYNELRADGTMKRIYSKWKEDVPVAEIPPDK